MKTCMLPLHSKWKPYDLFFVCSVSKRLHSPLKASFLHMEESNDLTDKIPERNKNFLDISHLGGAVDREDGLFNPHIASPSRFSQCKAKADCKVLI